VVWMKSSVVVEKLGKWWCNKGDARGEGSP
jgi:hypothetical protein